MIEYEEDWLILLLFRWTGSVYLRASIWSLPGVVLAVLITQSGSFHPTLRDDTGILDLNSGLVWSASTAVLVGMATFRAKMGYSRFWEGTGLLHQMKGEWFDTISNCITFSISARSKKKDGVDKFRHTIVRLMSLCHASALEEISGLEAELDTIDTCGLDYGTLRHLKECVEVHGFNKVEVLLHMIQSVITNANDSGLLAVPPPILSRVFQTISRGYVNLLNTKKITDTKFPFPFVQLITLLLMLHTFLTPMVLASVLTSPFLIAVVTFIVLFALHSLNFIAMELENPFGQDDNDLPLVHFQEEMNSCLLMLLHNNTDHVASVNERCLMDFDALKASLDEGAARDMNLSPKTSPRFSTIASEQAQLAARPGSVVLALAGDSHQASARQSQAEVRGVEAQGTGAEGAPEQPEKPVSEGAFSDFGTDSQTTPRNQQEGSVEVQPKPEKKVDANMFWTTNGTNWQDAASEAGVQDAEEKQAPSAEQKAMRDRGRCWTTNGTNWLPLQTCDELDQLESEGPPAALTVVIEGTDSEDQVTDSKAADTSQGPNATGFAVMADPTHAAPQPALSSTPELPLPDCSLGLGGLEKLDPGGANSRRVAI
mmetsp:Transcript_119217/g.299781  ORF Transcript_119217/g.299781 Transcript_119217/m.299781 type:complete len:599 (-) Transcript_119217:195-1991(-)